MLMNPFRVFLMLAAMSCTAVAAGKTRVLILSGANNHDWKQTTPLIKTALEETGRFAVDVEENVITIKPAAFAPYSVVLSNFNTFGKDAPEAREWPADTRQAFLDHIAKGNGLVIVHAGSSAFYEWPEFHKLACGTWRDGTNHGAIHINRVDFTAEPHPVTQGLAPFWIRDEFWQNIAVAPGAKPLATVTPDPAYKGSGKPENMIFSTETGGGRGFAIFLGHDALTMKNPAWRTLLQRGTEWAGTGKVTIPPATNWPATKEAAGNPELSWHETDTSLALCKGDQTIWRLVFDASQPKSYFHPLATVDGEVLTAFEPADHPWHRGLWWSWKFINGLNYWEEDPKTRISEGVTELTRATVKPAGDFTARAELCFSYHPPGQPAVMTELRQLSIGRPDAAGQYVIDWTSEFTAGDAAVELDRTLPPHQPGGVSYGGYAGLSLRFPPGLQGWNFRTSEGAENAATGNGKAARWADLSGPTAGITVFDHPGNIRHPSPWYLHEGPHLLYFSPAVLFNEPLQIAARQKVKFKYRVVVHSKPVTTERIETEWRSFSVPANP
jgi:type 1 glutamine amidotransferase